MRNPKRVFGYARVSSLEQALGTSLHDQQDVIRAYAKRRGLKVDRMFVESESAVHEKAEKREQVRALMADVRAGDLVLVDKLDRWSRDPEFTYGSIRQILAADASFFAVGDNCDPSTRDGDTMLGVRVLVAREEHKRIRERMVGTRKLLRDRGYYVEGLPPWGYLRQNVKGIDRNKLLVDEVQAERVRDAFKRCIGGESLQEIADHMRETRDRVADAMHNRVYLGETKDSRGNWIKGQHAAIIAPHVFAAAQDALRGRFLGQRRAHEGSETAAWWLRDLARCALCNAKMSAAYAGPKTARRYYFLCYKRCTRRYVPVRMAEQLCEILVMDRLRELRHEIADAKAPAAKARPTAKDIEGRRAKLDARRQRFLDVYADGDMTRDELRARLDRIDRERTELDALTYEPPPVTLAERRSVLRDVTQLRAAWEKSKPAARRQYIESLARAVYLAADRAPRFEWFTGEELARR